MAPHLAGPPPWQCSETRPPSHPAGGEGEGGEHVTQDGEGAERSRPGCPSQHLPRGLWLQVAAAGPAAQREERKQRVLTRRFPPGQRPSKILPAKATQRLCPTNSRLFKRVREAASAHEDEHSRSTHLSISHRTTCVRGQLHGDPNAPPTPTN